MSSKEHPFSKPLDVSFGQLESDLGLPNVPALLSAIQLTLDDIESRTGSLTHHQVTSVREYIEEIRRRLREENGSDIPEDEWDTWAW